MKLRKRRGRISLQMQKLLVSGFLVGVLVLQAQVLILFFPHTSNGISRWIGPPKLWPFVHYPMYRTSHEIGDTVTNYHVYAVSGNRAEYEITADDLGVGRFHFLRFAYAIEIAQAAKLNGFVELYRQRTGRSIRMLRLEDHQLVFTGDALQPGAVKVVRTVNLAELNDE